MDALSREQADRLREALGRRTPAASADAAHVAYSAGAPIVIGAMGWLLTDA